MGISVFDRNVGGGRLLLRCKKFTGQAKLFNERIRNIRTLSKKGKEHLQIQCLNCQGHCGSNVLYVVNCPLIYIHIIYREIP